MEVSRSAQPLHEQERFLPGSLQVRTAVARIDVVAIRNVRGRLMSTPGLTLLGCS